jgi:spore photoproduct lyase
MPYKTKPRPKDFTKIEQHVRAFLESDGHRELLNSGELADSLMWEANGNPFSKFIISLFADQSRHRVLFLTKSNKIRNLLQIGHHDRAVISFSLNACSVAERFEKGAPPVKKRIEAASKLAEEGYEVRLRIDPMVPIPNWETEYVDLIDQIFSRMRPERITLGSLRGLQSTINQATDRSWVDYVSEKSGWGKKVPFATRYSMYSHIIGFLKVNGYHNIGLCKETLSIWQALGMDYSKIKCNCVA